MQSIGAAKALASSKSIDLGKFLKFTLLYLLTLRLQSTSILHSKHIFTFLSTQ